MEVEFDPAKNEINRRKHGLDLSFGGQVLADPALIEFLDESMDYGENRFLALGFVTAVVYAVVYTERPNSIRIISVRAADKREQAAYFSHGGMP
ncbi:MAG: BrnT family toxin [Azospirillaceae bacterium]|nr:BrnT family toxin [Azospirillaceae bacterium]